MPSRKRTPIEKYEKQLKKAIEARTGKECELWLFPQIHSTAANMTILDKLRDELEDAELVTPVTGSMQQMKNEVNPLLPYFDKLNHTLLLQYEALGLNYKTTPKKVTENTKQGGTEQDALAQLLNDAKNI